MSGATQQRAFASKISAASGALAGALQQDPAVCRAVKRVIDDMRADIYLAVRVDELVRRVNAELEASGRETVKVAIDDVKECLRYDAAVKIVKTKSAEVLWLWERNYYELVEKVADMAARYRSVLAEPENPDEYDDCGVLGCDKGDDDAQVDDWE